MTENPNFLYNGATQPANAGALMHVRYDGQSRDISLEALRVNQASTDGAIRLAVAAFLDVSADRLDKLIVERHSNGNMTVRPEAVFG